MVSRARVAASGFTLIELLITLAIIAAAVSLVSGLGVQQRDSAEIRAELLTLQREIKSFSHQAFYRSDNVRLEFSGNGYQAHFEHLSEQPPRRTFDALTFQPQTISFNQSGLPNAVSLSVNRGDVVHQLSLFEVIGFASEDIYVEQ